MSRKALFSCRWLIRLPCSDVSRTFLLFFQLITPILMNLFRPVPYPIPDDGPVGRMCSTLGRHVYRPAHLHVRINVRFDIFIWLPYIYLYLYFSQAGGFEEMITSLFFKGDPYVMSDAVFGVKSSLIVVSVFFLFSSFALFYRGSFNRTLN